MTRLYLDGQPLGEVKRLNLQPGDALVIESDRHLSGQEAAYIQARVSAAFPDHRILIVSPGLTVSVAGPEPTG